VPGKEAGVKPYSRTANPDDAARRDEANAGKGSAAGVSPTRRPPRAIEPPRRSLLAVGGAVCRLRKRDGGPGVEDVEYPPNSTAPGPHPIATVRAQAGRLALPVVMRRASMRWRVAASVALVRPVQEDGGRAPAHTAITDRQMC